jgi:hypothetical protein
MWILRTLTSLAKALPDAAELTPHFHQMLVLATEQGQSDVLVSTKEALTLLSHLLRLSEKVDPLLLQIYPRITALLVSRSIHDSIVVAMGISKTLLTRAPGPFLESYTNELIQGVHATLGISDLNVNALDQALSVLRALIVFFPKDAPGKLASTLTLVIQMLASKVRSLRARAEY